METNIIVVSIISVINKESWKRFFEKSFLLVDIKPEVVLGMLFLTMSNVDVDFQARNLQ